MRDRFSPQVLEQVKQRCDLADIVSQYIKLNRNQKALCPFHSDLTPSFSIHPKKQFWHCFGCGASGDVISFVQKIEGISFSDAVSRLAIQVGVSLPKSERFKSFANRRFERAKIKIQRLRFCRDILKEYEIERYAELRNMRRVLLLKNDKDSMDYMHMDIIEYCRFDALDEFIRKVERILDGIEEETRYGKKL